MQTVFTEGKKKLCEVKSHNDKLWIYCRQRNIFGRKEIGRSNRRGSCNCDESSRNIYRRRYRGDKLSRRNICCKKVLELVLKNGASPAEPGEFTKRAFLNGKMDLSQAEAVIDVINSENEYALQVLSAS